MSQHETVFQSSLVVSPSEVIDSLHQEARVSDEPAQTLYFHFARKEADPVATLRDIASGNRPDIDRHMITLARHAAADLLRNVGVDVDAVEIN